VLEGGEPFPLASDQSAERFLLVALADHVQAIRLARGDFDAKR